LGISLNVWSDSVDTVKNDFSKGSIVKNIMGMAIPMIIAQMVNVLYNIVDRIYIGHMPQDAFLALTGVGVCLPIISIVMAFSNCSAWAALHCAPSSAGAATTKRPRPLWATRSSCSSRAAFC
jgi:Na+-driven multidrug efflux pump